jgi:hypothetical protein
MWVILGQIVFYLLHHLEEIIKADKIWIMLTLGPNLHQQLFGFFWVSL